MTDATFSLSKFCKAEIICKNTIYIRILGYQGMNKVTEAMISFSFASPKFLSNQTKKNKMKTSQFSLWELGFALPWELCVHENPWGLIPWLLIGVLSCLKWLFFFQSQHDLEGRELPRRGLCVGLKLEREDGEVCRQTEACISTPAVGFQG